MALLLSLIRTGHTRQPVTLMVAIGGIGHFLLLIACVIDFLELRPGIRQWVQFFAGGGRLILAAALSLLHGFIQGRTPCSSEAMIWAVMRVYTSWRSDFSIVCSSFLRRGFLMTRAEGGPGGRKGPVTAGKRPHGSREPTGGRAAKGAGQPLTRARRPDQGRVKGMRKLPSNTEQTGMAE
jgi:hypothetical protein